MPGLEFRQNPPGLPALRDLQGDMVQFLFVGGSDQQQERIGLQYAPHRKLLAVPFHLAPQRSGASEKLLGSGLA